MDKNIKNISDFDDLIFATRNREYGAYQLRKKYNSVVIAGILIASLIGCSAVIIPFLIKPDDERILGGGARYVQVQMENLEPPEEAIYVPPAPPPPESARVEESMKYVPPVVVDTVFTTEKPTAATDEFLSQTEGDESESFGNGTGGDLLTRGDGSEVEEPFFIVEVMPTFRGGDLNKFREWINKRTNYPQAAVDSNIKGIVFLTFIVEKDGSVSNVKVLKGVHPLLDDEAVKVISESPNWTPGLQRGQPVRVRYQIPLNFTL
ncbi:MAG: energy transducer TonB [Bacteroidales bacterium]|nr:energy transducer TonB [Bacteroidales bacterium]